MSGILTVGDLCVTWHWIDDDGVLITVPSFGKNRKDCERVRVRTRCYYTLSDCDKESIRGVNHWAFCEERGRIYSFYSLSVTINRCRIAHKINHRCILTVDMLLLWHRLR